MIVLLGKSGSGKDTIRKELLKMGFDSVVAYTTRPMREDEIQGTTYNFVSFKDFYTLKEKGFFASTSSYKVLNNDVWDYGIARKDLKENSVVISNPKEVAKLSKLKELNPFIVYIDVSNHVLERRLDNRKEREESNRRYEADKNDFANIFPMIHSFLKNDGDSKPSELANSINNVYELYTSK